MDRDQLLAWLACFYSERVLWTEISFWRGWRVFIVKEYLDRVDREQLLAGWRFSIVKEWDWTGTRGSVIILRRESLTLGLRIPELRCASDPPLVPGLVEKIIFLMMAGKRYIKNLVNEFCDRGSVVESERVAHFNDIMHTILLLYNHVATSLRKSCSTGGSWVDKVFAISKVIPDTDEIRERLKIDESNYKSAIFEYYFGVDVGARIPSGVRDFKHLAVKMVHSDNYVIGWVLEVVTKMYRVHMERLRNEPVVSTNLEDGGT